MQNHKDFSNLPQQPHIQNKIFLSPQAKLEDYNLKSCKENCIEIHNHTFVSPSPSNVLTKRGSFFKSSDDKKALPLNELDSVKKTLKFELNQNNMGAYQVFYTNPKPKSEK